MQVTFLWASFMHCMRHLASTHSRSPLSHTLMRPSLPVACNMLEEVPGCLSACSAAESCNRKREGKQQGCCCSWQSWERWQSQQQATCHQRQQNCQSRQTIQGPKGDAFIRIRPRLTEANCLATHPTQATARLQSLTLFALLQAEAWAVLLLELDERINKSKK